MNQNRNAAGKVSVRIAVAISVAMVITACATPSSPVAPGTAQPSATMTTSPMDALSANGDVPSVLDPELLAGYPVTVTSQTTYSRHLYASWPQFGRSTIDAAISGFFRKTVETFDANNPQPKPNTSAPPELNLSWHLVASSPSVVGIVADGYEFTGASGLDFWHSMWIDPAADTVLASSDLVDVAAANASLTVAASNRKPKVSSLDLAQVGANPLQAATLVAFAPSGAMIVGFDECQVAACSEGRITLTLPQAETDAVLTATGKQAQAATMTPSSPGSSPSLAPTPSATTKAASPSPIPSSTSNPTSSPTSAPTSSPTGPKVNCAKLKCVALTFDDGPGPYTTKLLGYLKDKQAPATFFMLGQQVDTYPKIAKAVAQAGHEIGVHTWDHRSLSQLTAAQIDTELSSTVNILRTDAGVSATLLRPPYGAMNTTVKTEAKKAGLAVILWNVDTLDWKTRNTEKTVASALKDTRRGSIILLHDIHKTSVAAVPAIIDGLRAQGYTFVTVTDLLGNPQPGQKYFHGQTK
jgi:peptidoglycan-N-acetylglucosamine deacetylase